MNTLNILLFQVYPYIAIAVFLIGSWVRFDHAAYTWRSGSSQLLSDRGMRIGSNLFHVGMLAIIGGHTIGLLVPHHIYAPFIRAPDKQLLAMIAGGVFGVMNTMFAAISQRTKDIGVLRLMGYGRRHIVASFLLEALVIGLIGGVIGCALGSLWNGVSVTSILASSGGDRTYRVWRAPKTP